jgi:hypothetical protein
MPPGRDAESSPLRRPAGAIARADRERHLRSAGSIRKMEGKRARPQRSPHGREAGRCKMSCTCDDSVEFLCSGDLARQYEAVTRLFSEEHVR